MFQSIAKAFTITHPSIKIKPFKAIRHRTFYFGSCQSNSKNET